MGQHEAIAREFVEACVQVRDHTADDRVSVAQNLLNAAGFNASVNLWPMPREGGANCSGADAPAADAWLRNLLKALPRGHKPEEVMFVERWIGRARDGLGKH